MGLGSRCKSSPCNRSRGQVISSFAKVVSCADGQVSEMDDTISSLLLFFVHAECYVIRAISARELQSALLLDCHRLLREIYVSGLRFVWLLNFKTKNRQFATWIWLKLAQNSNISVRSLGSNAHLSARHHVITRGSRDSVRHIKSYLWRLTL